MKELVYATGTQANSEAEKEEKGKDKKARGLDISALTFMALAAIKALRETNIDSNFQVVLDLVKNRYIAMAIVLGYLAILGVDEHD